MNLRIEALQCKGQDYVKDHQESKRGDNSPYHNS